MTGVPPAKPDALTKPLDVRDTAIDWDAEFAAAEPPPDDYEQDYANRHHAADSNTTHVSDSPGAAALLDDVEMFCRRFVAYPSDHAAIAHVLWLAHTWVMDSWENTPRIAFLSPEPGSGKSRALEVSEMLVPRPVHAVNVSAAYLFRKVSDEDGAPTVLFDEVDTVFGPKAKENEDIRGLLNAGHRRGATAGRCIIRGKAVETEELPAYCAVALAGLHDLPDTLRSRSIIVRMRRRAPGERVESFRHRVVAPQVQPLTERLADWMTTQMLALRNAWPDIPEDVQDRDADCWEPLLAVADAAGGHWPQRARVAAVALVADARENTRESLGVRLLADLRTCWATRGEPEHLATEDVLEYLNNLDESPWGDLRGKPLDARGLSRRLAPYDVKPRTVRIGDKTPKGYERGDLIDPWRRYLNADVPDPVVADVADVADTSGHTRAAPADPNVADVADVADTRTDTGAGCTVCGDELDDLFGTGMHINCETNR